MLRESHTKLLKIIEGPNNPIVAMDAKTFQ